MKQADTERTSRFANAAITKSKRMNTSSITIHEAKERIRIPHLWQILNLAGNSPAFHGVTRSPFRDDTNASFSIFDDGRRFKDHGTGEGGDAITFYGLARNLENKQAVKEFLTLASNSL